MSTIAVKHTRASAHIVAFPPSSSINRVTWPHLSCLPSSSIFCPFTRCILRKHAHLVLAFSTHQKLEPCMRGKTVPPRKISALGFRPFSTTDASNSRSRAWNTTWAFETRKTVPSLRLWELSGGEEWIGGGICVVLLRPFGMGKV